MREMTKREQAEAIVAMVRAEYPICFRKRGPRGCLGDHYYWFRENHPEMSLPVFSQGPWARMRDGNDGWHIRSDYHVPTKVWIHNDAGRHDLAELALTDEIERAL